LAARDRPVRLGCFHWAFPSSLIVSRTSHVAPASAYAANRLSACAGVPVIGRSTAAPPEGSGGPPRKEFEVHNLRK
jgi:hypothetical protein